jgi:hypothetical protein
VTVAVPTSHRLTAQEAPLKNARERMDVIAAYRRVGSYRGRGRDVRHHPQGPPASGVDRELLIALSARFPATLSSFVGGMGPAVRRQSSPMALITAGDQAGADGDERFDSSS